MKAKPFLLSVSLAALFFALSPTMKAQSIRLDEPQNGEEAIRNSFNTETLPLLESRPMRQSTTPDGIITSTPPTTAKAPQKAANVPDGMSFWGSMTYSTEWDTLGPYTTPYGVYAVTPKEGMTPKLVAQFPKNALEMANGGGVFDDEYLHVVSYVIYNLSQQFCFPTYFRFKKEAIGTTGGERMVADTVYDCDVYKGFDILTISAAYDKATGKVFACMYDPDRLQKRFFGTIDYKTMKRTNISRIDKTILALAFDEDGTLYGVCNDGCFYRINKETGAFTLIGTTGINIRPTALESMTFDPTDGRLYWIPTMPDHSTALYEIDKTTGRATFIGNMPHKESFMTPYIAFRPEAGAPKAVSAAKAAFSGAGQDGTVSFTLPTQTTNGAALSGSLSYEVKGHGQVLASGNGTAGSTVTCKITAPRGQNRFYIRVSNSAGRSPEAFTDAWVGTDEPQAPHDVKLSIDNSGYVTLAWKESNKGVRGEGIDSTAVSYDITRLPDSVVVAQAFVGNEWHEQLGSREVRAFSYTLVPTYNHLSGESATSNKVVYGNAITPPYSENLDERDCLDLYTINNANHDVNTWEYVSAHHTVGSYHEPYIGNSDDYLFTPKIHLTTDKRYRISFDAYDSNHISDTFNGTTSTFTITFSNDTAVASQDSLFAATIAKDTVIHATADIIPKADGDYIFGIHDITSSNVRSYLYINNLKVEAVGSLFAPDTVTVLTATAGARGAMNAVIKFKAPTKTINGNALSKLTSIKVLEGARTVATIANPTIGQEYTVNDTKPVGFGIKTYTVYGVNDEGEGAKSSVSTFVGIDVPEGPRNVFLADNVDGTATLTWDSPQRGVNGGYIDSAQLQYTISTLKGSQFAVAATVKDKTYTITGLPTTGAQAVQYATVAAVNSQGTSQAERSNPIFTGAPSSLPFKETFPDGNFQDGHIWVSYTGNDNDANYFTLSDVASVETTHPGAIGFAPKVTGDSAMVYSQKISLAGAESPYLTFCCYYVPLSKMKVKVSAVLPNQSHVYLYTYDYTKETDANKGWKYQSVDLSQFKSQPYIQLCFTGIGDKPADPVVIDNITVMHRLKNDIAVDITSDKNILVGEKLKCTINIRNMGYEPASGMKVGVLLNGQKVLEQTVPIFYTIPAGEYLAGDFSVPTNMATADTVYLQGYATIDGDMAPENNTSGIDTVFVKHPTLISINDLTGSLGSDKKTVSLQWTAPENTVATITEDFEQYPDYEITNIGDWTLFDGDNEHTNGFTNLEFSHEYDKKAFIIFNPIGTGLTYMDDWAPHSGSKVAATFSVAYLEANDDWLISPLLTGDAQTVSMFVKSCHTDWQTIYNLERFEVLYSKTGKDTASFSGNILYADSASYDNWDEVKVNLPEGAKYFALHVNTPAKIRHQLFYVDDITYTRGGFIIDGYKIYRDGVVIDSVGKEQTTYVDKSATNGNHNYNVSIIYKQGESRLSNTVNLYTTVGITDINASEQKYVKDIYTIDGRRLSSPQPGIMIMRMSDGTVKKVTSR